MKNRLLKDARAGGSKVALASFARKAGAMGKYGRAKNRAQRKAAKLQLKQRNEDE